MFSLRGLDIYLNDHLAGAAFGVALSQRALARNVGTTLGEFLARLQAEIVADKDMLETIMARLGADRSPVKPAGAWTLEKVGRLKLNGRVRARGRSPLSRLQDLEGLQLGVTGKRSLWEALAVAFPEDERLADIDFASLIERADRQLSEIAEHRRAVAREALG
jgi:hypothetical protein